MSDSDNEVYHAKIVNSHGQKLSLTAVTPLQITSSLSRLYPFLIMFDNVLDNLLWITDDVAWNFINFVMLFLSARFLLTSQLVINSFESLTMNLLGVIFTYTNFISIVYYIQTIFEQLHAEEAPTVDDIVILLENINDKLDTIRLEILTLNGGNSFTLKKFLIFILMLSPFQFILFYLNIIDGRGYILLMLSSVALFHSSWIQSTGSILWRLIWIRKLYYGIWNPQIKLFTLQEYIDLKCSTDKTPIEITLDDLKNDTADGNLSNHLRDLLQHSTRDNHDNDDTKSFIIADENMGCKFQIVEIIIQENQRKWYKEGWSCKLLTFEKCSFYLILDSRITKPCGSKTVIEKQLVENGWDWLENSWKEEGWVYSDSYWNIIGNNDSLECYTRSRINKRFAFRELS